MNKIQMTDEKQYRSMMPLSIKSENERVPFHVTGYAATFERYPLMETDEGTIYEQFDRNCFDTCDMNDVVMQYDHGGKIFARTSNSTLQVTVDNGGLRMSADLSKSAAARDLFEEINNGLITKMSWGFYPDEYRYDKNTRTIIHTKIKKIFDVSAVSFPANENTSIFARSCNKIFGQMQKERRSQEQRKKSLITKIKITEELK